MVICNYYKLSILQLIREKQEQSERKLHEGIGREEIDRKNGKNTKLEINYYFIAQYNFGLLISSNF